MYEVHHLEFILPEPDSSMQDYARLLSAQIKSSGEIILIGVSIGGMIASELAEFINCEKIIIISSAKSSLELPWKYRIFKTLPLQKAIPGRLLKSLAKIAQPIIEPDQNKEKAVFNQMLNDKDPLFLKRTVNMIVNWNRVKNQKNIIHIHGDADNTIPLKNIRYPNYIIKGGSHMMALTKGREISKLVNEILE
jgi:pimeloyl-ACP methyl ester carboxylesterase